MFSHDTELALLAVVDLVNSAPECGGVEALPDAAAVESFVTRHHVTGVNPAHFADIASIHRIRERFRTVFGVADAEIVARRVNSWLSEVPVCPRLTDHDGYDWHVHYFAPGATLSEHVAVDGGMALAHVVTAEETDRLRVCEAPDCQAVLIDLSRNRSKRYCDARACGNRLNVAAYRERKRGDLHAVKEAWVAQFGIVRHSPLLATEAWSRLTQWEHHGHFIPFTTVRLRGLIRSERGAEFVARTAIGPLRFDDAMEVTFWQEPFIDEPGICRIVKKGRAVDGWAVLTVTPTADGCAVYWQEEARFRFGGPLLDLPNRIVAPHVFGRLVDGLLAG